jgi:hypothetical protein
MVHVSEPMHVSHADYTMRNFESKSMVSYRSSKSRNSNGCVAGIIVEWNLKSWSSGTLVLHPSIDMIEVLCVKGGFSWLSCITCVIEWIFEDAIVLWVHCLDSADFVSGSVVEWNLESGSTVEHKVFDNDIDCLAVSGKWLVASSPLQKIMLFQRHPCLRNIFIFFALHSLFWNKAQWNTMVMPAVERLQ